MGSTAAANMKTAALFISFLAATKASYVSNNQQKCSKVAREVCSDIQVPETSFVTERQCLAVPTTKQEQQCDFQPETNCFDEPRTITDIQQVQECNTVTERQCSTSSEQQCDTVQERQCTTNFEKECNTVTDVKQECGFKTEDECHKVPEALCKDATKTVSA